MPDAPIPLRNWRTQPGESRGSPLVCVPVPKSWPTCTSVHCNVPGAKCLASPHVLGRAALAPLLVAHIVEDQQHGLHPATHIDRTARRSRVSGGHCGYIEPISPRPISIRARYAVARRAVLAGDRYAAYAGAPRRRLRADLAVDLAMCEPAVAPYVWGPDGAGDSSSRARCRMPSVGVAPRLGTRLGPHVLHIHGHRARRTSVRTGAEGS